MAEVRAAPVEDVSAIAAIDPRGPGSPGQIRALVRRQASLVPVQRGQIASFFVLKPGHFYQRDLIDLLFAASRWRRRGIGRALLRACPRNASTSRAFVSTNRNRRGRRQQVTRAPPRHAGEIIAAVFLLAFARRLSSAPLPGPSEPNGRWSTSW
jgi:GNAT superfamily N-acetyltransferase